MWRPANDWHRLQGEVHVCAMVVVILHVRVVGGLLLLLLLLLIYLALRPGLSMNYKGNVLST